MFDRLKSRSILYFKMNSSSLIIIGFLVCGLIIFTLILLVNPHRVAGDGLSIFAKDGFVVSEGLSYKIRNPKVGEAVIFRAEGFDNDFIGIISGIKADSGENIFEVYSSFDESWMVRQPEIKRKIYLFIMSPKDISHKINDHLVQQYNTSDGEINQNGYFRGVEESINADASGISSATIRNEGTIFPEAILTPMETSNKMHNQIKVQSPTNSPNNIYQQKPKDEEPPIVSIQGGPSDGSSVDYVNICFPLMVKDNVSAYPKIEVRTRMDSAVWTSWGTDVTPCYQNLAPGAHAFVAQARDEAMNVSAEVGRNFTIVIP